MSCPFPHTTRDKVWLGLGATIGALAGYYATRTPQLKQKGPLKEFSVIYTDRAWNLMSSPFQECMRDIDSILKEAYKAEHTALIPGSGTYAMEAVAWTFAQRKKVMVIRNGYFSFRWSDIFDVAQITTSETVMKARAAEIDKEITSFKPCPLDEVIARISKERPDCVFAPHVETAAGILLNDDYLKAVADAVHSYGGFFVVDAIAAGTVWLDMEATGVDVVISAPQKGWSAPACVGIVLMNRRARQYVKDMQLSVNSFCCNLKKWCTVMDKYTGGGFMYYTTLPTDSLMAVRDAMKETRNYGFEKAKQDAFVLGARIREVLEKNGFKSVAAEGFKAPSVVVSYSSKSGMVGRFKSQGIQVAGGVPLKLGETFNAREICFRLGLFGLDKFGNIDKTVSTFEAALKKITS